MSIDKLIVITNDTIKEIRKLEIVTPSIYRDVFLSKAKEKNYEFKEEDDNDISLVLDKIIKMEEGTKKNSLHLQKNITMAKGAIVNKDESILERVEKNVDSLLQEIRRLESEIYVDELSKLYNRKWLFEKYLKDNRFQNSGTLAFIDINKFKKINDTFGHIVGDKVISLFSEILKNLDGATAIRYAGDEFILLFDKSNEEMTIKAMEMINENMMRKNFKFKGSSFKISFSYGVTTFKKNDDFDDITTIADEKMYEHKQMLNNAKLEIA